MWIMGLRWVFLLTLLIHVQAKDFNVSVNPTETASLNCSLDSDVYWYMEVHSGFKSRIFRTFGGRDDPDALIETSAAKFKTEGSNVLKILNITAEDYRLYLCAKKESGEIKFQDTFTLVPGGPQTTSGPPGDPCSTGENRLLLYSSFSVNILLLLLLTGLTSLFLCLRKRRLKDDTQETIEAAETPQYEEIQLPPSRAPPAALPRDDLYSKAGFPQGTLPPQRHLGRY